MHNPNSRSATQTIESKSEKPIEAANQACFQATPIGCFEATTKTYRPCCQAKKINFHRSQQRQNTAGGQPTKWWIEWQAVEWQTIEMKTKSVSISYDHSKRMKLDKTCQIKIVSKLYFTFRTFINLHQWQNWNKNQRKQTVWPFYSVKSFDISDRFAWVYLLSLGKKLKLQNVSWCSLPSK